MHYLYGDMQNVKSGLLTIASNSNSITSSTVDIASSLGGLEANIDQLQSAMSYGFDSLEFEVSAVFYQIGELIDEVKLFRDQQFIQNKERNELLASIDASLKAPNKTAAQEQYEIALELAERGNHEHALKFLGEAIKLNPLHYRAYVETTLIYLRLRRYDEALHYAKESLFYVPKRSSEILGYTHYLLAGVYEKNNQFDKAIEHIEQAIHHNNRLTFYTYERIRYLAQGGYTELAINELVELVQKETEYFSKALVDSAFLACHKELEKALTDLKKSYEDEIIHMREVASKVVVPLYDLSLRDYESGKWDHVYFYNYSGKSSLSRVMGFYGKSVEYRYNKLIEAFKKYYISIKEQHEKELMWVNQQFGLHTFEAYSVVRPKLIQIRDMFNNGSYFLTEYVNNILGFQTDDFHTFLIEEKLALKESMREDRKKIREEKKGTFFGLNISDSRKRWVASHHTEIQKKQEQIDLYDHLALVEPKMTEDLKHFCEDYLEKRIPTFEYRFPYLTPYQPGSPQ